MKVMAVQLTSHSSHNVFHKIHDIIINFGHTPPHFNNKIQSQANITCKDLFMTDVKIYVCHKKKQKRANRRSTFILLRTYLRCIEYVLVPYIVAALEDVHTFYII